MGSNKYGDKMIKHMLKFLSYIIIISVILFAMMLVGVKIFGLQIYTVLSGSMEPDYKVGSLIYVKGTDINELEVGDVITFRLTSTVVATHRIVQIVNENNQKQFKTKGDANDYEDEGFISGERIIGQPILTIPYMGYIASFMQTLSGKIITAGVSLLLIIIIVIIDAVTDDKKKKIKN